MIAAGIVSSWTHATTLLTSCMLAYLYGVSGGLWYGAVGTFQVSISQLISGACFAGIIADCESPPDYAVRCYRLQDQGACK
jgi:Na+/proline symporter